jgi:DNA topoisomerase-1
MSKALVIVESPAKAKTISAILGDDFIVESSIGHIRDLPQGADQVPAEYKGESWARIGVNVDDGFKPLYVVNPGKKEVVRKLTKLMKEVDEVFLATDEDREGEAIAWHLLEVLNPQIPVKRMVFHEITRSAIEKAVEESRDLDRRLVDAQEARRILDRLYGYEVSPVLWKKILPRLSAGRVQSVATRLVVERERERMAFRSASWHDVVTQLKKDDQVFEGQLVSLDEKQLAEGKDFDDTGALVGKREVLQLDEVGAQAVATALLAATPTVTSVSEKPFTSKPQPPFMTSTLQQEAGRKLRLSAQMAMRTAQRLYEEGWITYMRTDSTTLSDEAINAARTQARQLFGDEYVPDTPRRYDRKVKNAQEAHEAIRPAGESFRTPEEAGKSLRGDELRLYELIWVRTMASQMADARGTQAQVRFAAQLGAEAGTYQGSSAVLQANGRVISFPGYRRAYVESADDPEAELAEAERVLPAMAEGNAVGVTEAEAKSHTTQPPARFTDASLVKKMEELGIGRPSTYAAVITTIQDRGYVWKKGSALVPSFTAFAVVKLLEEHFAELVDYNFTASMEDDLDAIASGTEEALPWLSRFYFGHDPDGVKGFGLHEAVSGQLTDIDPVEINSIPLGDDPKSGVPIVARVGKFGPYLKRGDDTVSLREDTLPDELTPAEASELLDAPQGDRSVGLDPETGLDIFVKAGRFGPYLQLGDASDGEKPKTASLLATMTPEKVTLEEALQLLSLPRLVGVDPESKEEILAQNGRYGPYMTKGKDSRSLTTEDEIFTVTLEQALVIYAQPKQGRGRGIVKPPLRDLGPDPATGEAMLVKDGRFGPYVTDGTTNASLRVGDRVEEITPERGAELLAIRREAGPAKKRSKKKAAKKKAPAKKKTAAKKATTKKAAAKKTVAKKVSAVKSDAVLATSSSPQETEPADGDGSDPGS